MLTESSRQRLLLLARESVAARVCKRPSPLLPIANPLPASGVFVTVKHRGMLRGCLGTLEPVEDLAPEVARCAADAASQDPRFKPMTPDELPDLSVDVSVLGPLEAIDPRDATAIVIGEHGLVVEQGRYRGVLLPQVASERKWTREQFIRQTCVKASLAPDAWEHGAIVYRFSAEVFGD
ncbi:MAG TPA: AmmeMemoRadiSam system protein A [Vicinamibacterales bacterium]